MSPYPAGPQGLSSIAKPAPPEPVGDNRPQSPSDDVDFIVSPPLSGRDEHAMRHRDGSQTGGSNGNFVPANNMLPPPSPRFRPDTRPAESDFQFAPAPRHAPGHFTNRKIVPRVDEFGTQRKANQQHSAISVLKENEPVVLTAKNRPATPIDEESEPNAPRASPSRNMTPALSAQLPSLAPTPLSIGGMAPPAQKIGLPFRKNQPSGDAAQQPLPDPIHSAHPRHPSKSPNGIQSAQPRRSSISPPLPAQSPPSGNRDEVEEKDKAMLHLQDKPETSLNEVHQSVSVPGNPKEISPHFLEVIMEEDEAHEQFTEPEILRLQLANEALRHSTTAVLPQNKGYLNAKEWNWDSQSARVTRDKERRQINRPVRPVSQARPESRSSPSICSSGSGVSKRTTRSIRDLNVFRDRDLPEVANKVNDLWRLCNNAVKEAETESQHKVEKYRKRLHERSQKMDSYLDTINAQAQALQILEDEKQDMHDCIQKLEQQVRANSNKVPGLQQKYRSMKESLESTLKEQQEQYASHCHYKQATQEAIDEFRADKQREKAARELVEHQLAAVREQMKDRVRKVEIQSQEECRHVNDKMHALSQLVGEKEAQATRDRDITDRLLKQLEEYRQAQPSLDEMRTQTSEILRMLSDRQGEDTMEQVMSAQAGTKTKLENMTAHLESLEGLLVPHGEALSTLSGKQGDGMSQIKLALDTMLETQNGSKDSVKQLGTDLRAHLDELYQQLKTREDDLKQQLEEKRGEISLLTRVIQEANDTLKVREKRVHDLALRVEELEAQPREDPEAKIRSEALSADNDRLKTELVTDSSKISDLEARVKSRNESHMAEVDKLSREITRVKQLLRDLEGASKLESDKKLAKTKEQHSEELQRLEHDMRDRLQRAEDDRLLVAKHLNETQVELTAKEQMCNEVSDNAKSFQEALKDAELRVQEITDDSQQRAKDFGAKQDQDYGKISSLRADLHAAQKAASDIREDHRSQSDTLKGLQRSLWKWARGQAVSRGFASDFDQMWRDTQSIGNLGDRWAFFLQRVLPEVSLHGTQPRADALSAQASFTGFEATPNLSTHHTPNMRLVEPAKIEYDDDDQSSQQSLSNQVAMIGPSLRHVSIKSPHPGVLTPVPPSVEQEKSRRRGNMQQPKPIMKRVTRSSTNADASQPLAQDSLSTSSLVPGYGLQFHQPSARLTDPIEKEQSDTPSGNQGLVLSRTGATQHANLASGASIKIKLKGSKRPRKTSDAEQVEPFAGDRLENHHGPVTDDDDVPQTKKAKLQKPKSPPSSRRKRTSSAARMQKPPTGLFGVVHGSFPPGTMQGTRHQPSELELIANSQTR